MADPAWYAAWRAAAFDQLMKKQDLLTTSFRLGSWPRYDYDVEAGTLMFSDATGPKVRAEIQVVGTTSQEDWLWSWANATWPKSSFEDVLRVRDFGAANDIAELTSDFVKEDDLNALGWAMTAIAARVLDSVGGYRAPSPNAGAVFFIYRSIKFVS